MAGAGHSQRRNGSRPVAWRCLNAAVLALVAGVSSGLVGCENRECEAARLELAQTWETLRDTATSRQQIPEGTDLSKLEEGERVRIWKNIEDKAELIRSSFQTPQVTWPSADKARADLDKIFQPIASSDDQVTRGFAVTLAEADRRVASFRRACR
jgi:hypothetical protein